MRYSVSIFFAALIPFCGGAAAQGFSCMDNAYKGGHQILSWEQYQSCVSLNFPALQPDKADYEAQAAKLRKEKERAELYRPAPAETVSQIPADTKIINFESGNAADSCEFEAVREVMIEAAPRAEQLDAGQVYYNSAAKTLLFKRGALYAAYLPLCGALKLVLFGADNLKPYRDIRGAASAL